MLAPVDLTPEEMHRYNNQPPRNFLKEQNWATQEEAQRQIISAVLFDMELKKEDEGADTKVVTLKIHHDSPNMEIVMLETNTEAEIMKWQISKCLQRSAKIVRVKPDVGSNASKIVKHFQKKYSGSVLGNQAARATVPELAFELFGYLAHKERQFLARLELCLVRRTTLEGQIVSRLIRPPNLTKFWRSDVREESQNLLIQQLILGTKIKDSEAIHVIVTRNKQFIDLTPHVRAFVAQEAARQRESDMSRM